MRLANLGYASTAYGVQGATVDASHTVLSDALDAAGVYVGMTRGRHTNVLHIVATDLEGAREQFAAALVRDRADRGLTSATTAARDEIVGLVEHGPVAVVNEERARLRAFIAQAETQAKKAEDALAGLAEQARQHQIERDQAAESVTAADAYAARVRAETVTPHIEQAAADGKTFLVAREWMWETHRARPSRFGKRAAVRTSREADIAHRAAERDVLDRWGRLPQHADGLSAWAEAVVGQQADRDARGVEAKRQAEEARMSLRHLDQRQVAERSVLSQRILGNTRPSTLAARAIQLNQQAKRVGDYLARLESLLPAEAVRLILRPQERAEVGRAASEQTRRQAEAPTISPPHPGPERGRGRSL